MSPSLLSSSGRKVTNSAPTTMPGIEVAPPITGISRKLIERSTVKLCVLTNEAWWANRLPARLPNSAHTTKTLVRSACRSIERAAAAVLESRMARSMRPVRLSTRFRATAMQAKATIQTKK